MERRAGHGRQSPRSVHAEGSLLEGWSLRGEEVVQAGVGGSEFQEGVSTGGVAAVRGCAWGEEHRRKYV